jgi:hypothetical protein
MELFLTIGSYKSITEMLDCIDSVTYDFLLAKYRKVSFGWDMINYQLAQVSWVQANTFTKSHVQIEQLIHGELGELKATDQEQVAGRLIREDYFRLYLQEGNSKEEASRLADEKAKEYVNGLKQQRMRKEILKDEQQDLSNAENK